MPGLFSPIFPVHDIIWPIHACYARDMINPHEKITLQLGQCGNQGETTSRKVYVYINGTLSKRAPHSGSDYAQNMASSIRMEFSRSGRQTEVIERTYFSIRPTMNFMSLDLSSWIWNLGYECGTYTHLKLTATLTQVMINNILTSSYSSSRLYNPENIFFQRMVVVLETIGLKAMQPENRYMEKSRI